MFDLCTMAEKSLFHPDTKGSNSIKKVLPAALRVSDVLKQTYSQPVYGAPGGIPSINFASAQGFVWIDVTQGSSISDPYARLKQYARDRIKSALLRYCELDTLAMVMVVQAWRGFLA